MNEFRRFRKRKTCPVCNSSKYEVIESKTEIGWKCCRCGYTYMIEKVKVRE